VPLYRDEAVVLRTHKLGEVDRILTLLTKNHGQVRAVAKGVRKTTSRFGARLEPFMVADLQLYEGRNLDTVSQAETLASYGGPIVSDYQRFTAANAIVETAERLSRETSNSQQYLLLLGALRALANQEHETQLILDAYLLRALALSGWSPAFESCSSCGGEAQAFSTQTATVSCSHCAQNGAVQLGAAGIAHMRALVSGDWQLANEATKMVRDRVSGVVAAYLQWQLERTLKSFPILERSS
jgi:DNA repair protein RecO (recombination protein O)